MAGVIIGIIVGMGIAGGVGVLIPRMDDLTGLVRGRIVAPLFGWIAAVLDRRAKRLKSTGWA